MPGLGISLLLIAIGAILAFAVTLTTSAVAIPTVGVILMIVGAIGVVISLIAMMGGGGPWGWRTGRVHRVEHVDRIEDDRWR
jgi:hypothetical protein